MILEEKIKNAFYWLTVNKNEETMQDFNSLQEQYKTENGHYFMDATFKSSVLNYQTTLRQKRKEAISYQNSLEVSR